MDTDTSVGRKSPHGSFPPSGIGDTCSDSDVGGEAENSAKTKTSRRGKAVGKGRGTGLARARAELKRRELEADEQAFEQSLRKRAFRKDAPAPEADLAESSASEARDVRDTTELGPEELRAKAGETAAVILEVAKKSGNLKGPYIRKLKDSAATLRDIVETLLCRTEAEETRRLRVDNCRLRREADRLKAEIRAHRREFAERQATTAEVSGPGAPAANDDFVEALKASIVSSVGSMLDARLALIEERLPPTKALRSPPAADKRTATAPISTPPRAVAPAVARPTLAEEPNRAETEAWSTVVGRKSRRKGTPATVAPGPQVRAVQPPRSAKPKMTVPRTAAVIVTLRPEAAEKGVTYAQVMERAEGAVDLEELGIGAGLRVRRAATGARLLELPEAQTPEKAEELAVQLRSALDGIASVVRPTKFVALKITGLDDSVTKEKVSAAVARVGGCTADAVKAGEILPGPGGMGMCTVRCPIAAAKAASEAGRILVGWSSARVEARESRPLRCYRCMGIGHTRALCRSEVDRSGLCFRCGDDGHKSSECTMAPHCDICARAGKPPGHIMGGKSCNPTVPKTRAQESQSAPERRPARDVEVANVSA